MSQRDNWPMARGQGEHFTEEELWVIQYGFMEGRSPNWVALRIGCSASSVNRRYRMLRGIRTKSDWKNETVGSTKHDPSPNCFVANCFEAPVEGAKFCDQHTYRPPAGADLKLLMAGR